MVSQQGCRRRRYAFMLAMMALGALLAVGSAGPVLAMVALMLPPDSKSFGLSVFHCGVSVIDPTASVVLGIVLQARVRARASWSARDDAPGRPALCVVASEVACSCLHWAPGSGGQAPVARL